MRNLFPSESKEFHNQTSLSTVTDEELIDNSALINKPKGFAKFVIFILFILSFGILRLIGLVLALLVYILFMMPVIPFLGTRFVKHFTKYGIFITQCYIRVFAFCCGMFYIKVEGQFEPDTRMFCFNHQTLFDGPLIYIYKVFTVISMAEMLKVPLFGQILAAVDTVFIDRTKAAGASTYITEAIEQENRYPVALAPEGKTTQGKFLLKFHSGGFLTTKPFQTVTIRYTTYGTFGLVGYNWNVGGFGSFIYRILSIPFATVTISISKQHTTEEIKDMKPEERALLANLEIANKLGLKASDRTNTEAVNLLNEYLGKKVKKD